MQLYSLRIPQSKGGLTFPFDRVNLVKHDDRAIIERLYRYALVFPLEARMRGVIESLKGRIEFRTQARTDTAPKIGSFSEMLGSKKTAWIVVVPLNGTFDTATKTAHPRYLTARPTVLEHALQKQKVDKVFSDLAYLQAEKKKIRPVCLACPQYIDHMNGLCHLGTSVCLDALALNKKDIMAPFDNDEDEPVIGTRDAPAVGAP